MDKYNEVATRFRRYGNLEFTEGSIIRTVSLSQRDADILNGMESDHGVKYVKIEKKAEPTKKEVRDALIAKANDLGVEFKKNISNEELAKLIGQC